MEAVPNMHTVRFAVCVLLAGACAHAAGVKPVERASSEQVLGKSSQGTETGHPGRIRFGPTGRNVAWSDGRRAFLNGAPLGKRFKSIDIESFVFSPDGRRTAYIAGTDRGQLVVLDGREGKIYDEVSDLGFIEGGKDVVYSGHMHFEGPNADRSYAYLVVGQKEVARHDSIVRLFFSEDRTRFGYVAKSGNAEFIVANGERGKEYPRIQNDLMLAVTRRRTGPAFSPDGRRICFVAKVNGRECVVLDGKEGKRFHRIDEFAFSRKGEHLAYSGTTERDDDQVSRIVLDGERVGDRYFGTRRLWFSDDGRRLACFVSVQVKRTVREKLVILANGRIVAEYFTDTCPETVLNADFTHVALLVRQPDNEVFAVGRSEHIKQRHSLGRAKSTKRFLPPRLSPDGRRFAFVAPSRGGRERLRVDGKEGKAYHYISFLEFSANSRRIAYVAMSKPGRAPAFDGRPLDRRPSASWVVVVDGKEQSRYDQIRHWESMFTPDSRHAVYVGRRAGKERVVIDGTAGKQYDTVLLGKNSLVFEAPDTVRYYAREGDRFLRVTERLSGPHKKPEK